LKQHSSGFFIGIAVAIILGFGIVAGIALSLQSVQGLGYEPGVLKATPTSPGNAQITIATMPDSQVCHGDMGDPQINWVSYCPTTSLVVPANSVITMTIMQYDTPSTLINDYFRQVRGTIGGTMLVNNKPVSEVSADSPGHTFTLQSPPNAPYPLFVNVPLVGVPDSVKTTVKVNDIDYPTPNIISFKFQTGPPGTYIWHCYVPCGSDRGVPYGFSGPMSTTGYMAGTLTVTN
jgi:hypothetical protein